VLSGRLKWSEWDAADGHRQAIEIHADSIVPITTLKDSGKPTKTTARTSTPCPATPTSSPRRATARARTCRHPRSRPQGRSVS
jgi:single-stranded DNA-binding protein